MRRFAILMSLTVAIVAAGIGNAGAVDYPIYGTGPVTISIVKKGGRLSFRAPWTVSKGARLRIVNTTADRHTFTLVKPGAVPRTKKQLRACNLCRQIAVAHRYDAERDRIRKRVVDTGKEGWDKPTGTVGDSWYVDVKGKSHSRKVTAAKGTTLTFFCGVHPRMTGTIRVVAGAG